MIAYRGTLDVPRELVWFAAKLLAASGADAAPAGQQGAALPLVNVSWIRSRCEPTVPLLMNSSAAISASVGPWVTR